MSLITYFRALLCIFIALVGGEIASDLLTVSWLPEPLRKHVEEQTKDGPITEDVAFLALLSVTALGLMLLSVIGLWVFWPPARLLYTLFLLTLACAVAASGNVVQSALTSVLAFMNTIIAGVILGMIYFSPLREQFEPPPEDRPTA